MSAVINRFNPLHVGAFPSPISSDRQEQCSGETFQSPSRRGLPVTREPHHVPIELIRLLQSPSRRGLPVTFASMDKWQETISRFQSASRRGLPVTVTLLVPTHCLGLVSIPFTSGPSRHSHFVAVRSVDGNAFQSPSRRGLPVTALPATAAPSSIYTPFSRKRAIPVEILHHQPSRPAHRLSTSPLFSKDYQKPVTSSSLQPLFAFVSTYRKIGTCFQVTYRPHLTQGKNPDLA